MAITIDGAGTITGLDADGISSQPVFAGNVLQVVSDSFTGTESTSVLASSGNFVDTSLSVSIIPSSVDSKIIVTAMVNTGSSTASDGVCILRMTRNGTPVAIGDADGSRIRTTTGRGAASANSDTLLTQTIHFIDEPSSTSTVNYAVQFAVRGTGSSPAYINRTSIDGDTNEYQRTASFITAMEIAG